MNPKVLIVEDEVLLALSYKLDLESNDCEVMGIVYSGEEAIAGVEKSRPNLVLMDIKLQGEMDGIEAAGIIMKRFNIPIIYITGNTDDVTKERALQTSPLAYLEKPVESEQLCSLIMKSLY